MIANWGKRSGYSPTDKCIYHAISRKNRIRARTHVKSKNMIAQKRSGTSVV